MSVKYEWERRAEGILDGSAYALSERDSGTTQWREYYEAEGVCLRCVIDRIAATIDDKAAFWAYVMNGISLQAIAFSMHLSETKVQQILDAMHHLVMAEFRRS